MSLPTSTTRCDNDQLMRQREKMIQDMEKAVYRREAIMLRLGMCVCVCVCVCSCVFPQSRTEQSHNGFCGMGTVLTSSVMILQPCIANNFELHNFIVLIIILVSGIQLVQ